MFSLTEGMHLMPVDWLEQEDDEEGEEGPLYGTYLFMYDDGGGRQQRLRRTFEEKVGIVCQLLLNNWTKWHHHITYLPTTIK